MQLLKYRHRRVAPARWRRYVGLTVVKSFERIAMEHYVGVGTLDDIDAWIVANLDTDPALPDILHGLRRDKHDAFLRFAIERCAFDPRGPGGALEATNILRDLASQVLRGELAVPELGRTVKRLDEILLDSGICPDVLCGLWNAFDWCDEWWTLENQPHLREQLEAAATPLRE